MKRVLVSIPNLLLQSQVRLALKTTGHEVESVPLESVAERVEEPWHLMVADLSALGPAAAQGFPRIPDDTRALGIITHRDVVARPHWEGRGFSVVFRGDFFSRPERYLFP